MQEAGTQGGRQKATGAMVGAGSGRASSPNLQLCTLPAVCPWASHLSQLVFSCDMMAMPMAARCLQAPGALCTSTAPTPLPGFF